MLSWSDSHRSSTLRTAQGANSGRFHLEDERNARQLLLIPDRGCFLPAARSESRPLIEPMRGIFSSRSCHSWLGASQVWQARIGRRGGAAELHLRRGRAFRAGERRLSRPVTIAYETYGRLNRDLQQRRADSCTRLSGGAHRQRLRRAGQAGLVDDWHRVAGKGASTPTASSSSVPTSSRLLWFPAARKR